MDVFLILSSIFILAYIAVRQILKNVSGQIPPEESAKYLPFVLFSASFVLLSNLCAGESAISRVPYSLSLAEMGQVHGVFVGFGICTVCHPFSRRGFVAETFFTTCVFPICCHDGMLHHLNGSPVCLFLTSS